MNLPNRLTLARLALTVFFVVVMSLPFPGHYLWALGFFLLATITDYLDGVVARRYDLVTDFGKLMDPLVDKILTAAAFILLIPAQTLPAWIVIVIISREFLITGLRVLANAKGQILPAERLGKHKTAWQMVTILYFLILLGTQPWWPEPWWSWSQNTLGSILVAITTVLTVYSGGAYFWKNRSLIADT